MSLTFDLKIGRFPVMHYEVVRLVDDVPPHPEGIFKYRATATPPGEWADLYCQSPGGWMWPKRQPLPFPASFTRVEP